MHVASSNFEKAFDIVSRNILWQVLEERVLESSIRIYDPYKFYMIEQK